MLSLPSERGLGKGSRLFTRCCYSQLNLTSYLVVILKSELVMARNPLILSLIKTDLDIMTEDKWDPNVHTKMLSITRVKS